MKIELRHIKIKDLVVGYCDSGHDGVIGYTGLLDIRPAYQREFVYKDEARNKVIDTIRKNFPLNVMYWIDNGKGKYEILDGQQRTISICQYVIGKFGVNGKAYHNLTIDQKQNFDNYELMVYFCSGTESEKLEWFKIINIGGEKLTEQELRNAVYTGSWLTDAKKYFSQNNCVAYQKASKYLTGSAIRQEYLETVLKWISHRDNKKINIENYMSTHQKDNDSDELRQYFDSVISWIDKIFKVYRKDMKGVEWGILYNTYAGMNYNSNKVEEQISKLIDDDEVTNKKGIYEYILSGKENCLNIRIFNDKDKLITFNRQLNGTTGKATCPKCNDNNKLYDLTQMEADHIIAWSKGGKTIIDNCQMLCKYHNGIKSNS